MRLLVPIAVGVFAVTVTASAQDTTVKSKTRVDVEDGHVVTMTGCLRQDALTGRFTLHGTVAAAGEEVTTRTRVETDVDDDDIETRVRSGSQVDDDPVGTTGRTMSAFTIVAGENVNLIPHVGRSVQLSAVMPGHDDDAEVEIRNRTNVDPDDAHDTTTRTRTELEVENGARGYYTVVAVTPLGGACPVP